MGLFVNTTIVDGNRIYCNLIRSHMALNGLTPTLKEAKTMKMWEYILVEQERNKKPKLPKKRLNKILKKKGRP